MWCARNKGGGHLARPPSRPLSRAAILAGDRQVPGGCASGAQGRTKAVHQSGAFSGGEAGPGMNPGELCCVLCSLSELSSVLRKNVSVSYNTGLARMRRSAGEKRGDVQRSEETRI